MRRGRSPKFNQVEEGKCTAEQETLDGLLSKSLRRIAQPRGYELTPREVSIATGLADGYTSGSWRPGCR